MGATTIEKKINTYLVQLSTSQKKAILSVVKAFADEQDKEDNVWDDKDFVAEIEHRTTELESGKIKGHTWEEVKQKARQLGKYKKLK